MQPTTFEAKLIRARALTPSVRELVFERADGEPFRHEPGQWVNLMLPLGEQPLKRAYSIASAPRSDGRFELAITRVEGGVGSNYLHAIEPGQSLLAVGPHGVFTRPVDGPPSLFVATGTGIAPLRSMIHAAVEAGSGAPLWVLLGVREQEDLLYRDELEALALRHSNVRFIPTLSRANEAWPGRRGYVQTHVGSLYGELCAASEGEPHVFVCGLDRMVTAVKSLLRGDLNASRKHVHVERFD